MVDGRAVMERRRVGPRAGPGIVWVRHMLGLFCRSRGQEIRRRFTADALLDFVHGSDVTVAAG